MPIFECRLVTLRKSREEEGDDEAGEDAGGNELENASEEKRGFDGCLLCSGRRLKCSSKRSETGIYRNSLTSWGIVRAKGRTRARSWPGVRHNAGVMGQPASRRPVAIQVLQVLKAE